MLPLNPVVYLPFELKSRDLDARLLIAAHIIESGFCVVIGQQWSIHANIETMPRGCILFKSMNAISAEAICRSREAGHIVTATDEEALARLAPEFLSQTIDRTALEACDLFFAQNDHQVTAIQTRFPGLTFRAQVSGNARLDLLTSAARALYAEEANAIKSLYEPFILFNTKFTRTNSMWGSAYDVAGILIKARMLDANSKTDKQAFISSVREEELSAQHTTSLIKWILSELPHYRVIVRPHPNESKKNWESTFAGNSNVAVVGGQSPIPWIMASDILIHTNCTTGLEAFLLGHPTLNLVPDKKSPLARRFVMPQINTTLETWGQVAKILKAARRGNRIKFSTTDRKKNYQTFVPAHGRGHAAQEIAASMIALLRKRGISAASPNAWRIKPQRWLTPSRKKVEKEKLRITPEELQSRFDVLRALSKTDTSVQIGKIDDSLFLMMPSR